MVSGFMTVKMLFNNSTVTNPNQNQNQNFLEFLWYLDFLSVRLCYLLSHSKFALSDIKQIQE